MSKEKSFLSNLFGGKSKGGCCNIEIVEEAESNCCPEEEQTEKSMDSNSCCGCDSNSKELK